MVQFVASMYNYIIDVSEICVFTKTKQQVLVKK